MRLSQKVSVSIFIMPLVFTKLIQRIPKTLDEDKIKSILDCLEMVSCGYKEREGFEEHHAKMITSMSKCIEQAEEDNEVVVNKRQQLDYQLKLKFLLAELEKCRDVTYKVCGKQRDEKTTVHEEYDDIVVFFRSEVSQIVQFIVHKSCQISDLLHKSIEEENKPEIRESRIFGRYCVTLRCKAVTDAEEDFNPNEKGTYKCKALHARAKEFIQIISIDILGAFKNDCLAFNKLEGMENIKEEIFDNIDATVARLKFFGRYFTAYSMYCQRIDLNAVDETYFEAMKAFDVLYGIVSSDYIKKNREAKESLLSSKKAMYEVNDTKLDHVLENLHKLGINKIVSEWVMSLTTRSFFTIFTKSDGKECRHESVKPAVKIPNHFEQLLNVFKVHILTYTRLMCEKVALNKEISSANAEAAIILQMLKKALFKARMALIAFKTVADDDITGGDLFIIAELPEHVVKAISVVYTMQNRNDFYGKISQHLDRIHLKMKALSDKFQKTINLLIEQYKSEQGQVHKMENLLDAKTKNHNAKTLVDDFKHEFLAEHKMIDDNLERLCEARTLRYDLKGIQDDGSVTQFDTYSNVPKIKQQQTCPTSFELANRASSIADDLQFLIEKTEQSILHEKIVLDGDSNKTKDLLDHTVFLLDTIACTYKQRHEKTKSHSQFKLDEKDIGHCSKILDIKNICLNSL